MKESIYKGDEIKNMRAKPYKPKRIFLETLIGYIEAIRIIKPIGEWNK